MGGGAGAEALNLRTGGGAPTDDLAKISKEKTFHKLEKSSKAAKRDSMGRVGRPGH